MSIDLRPEPLESPLLNERAGQRIRHGFFTRKGGASSGIFAGLNCGPGSSDMSEAVTVNRARVAEALGLAPEALVSLNQTHSADVAVLVAPPTSRLSADAMVTATPGVGLGILTADCQPVLFADAQARVIGAAHAGWRGTRDGVLEATISAMETLGARREAITVAIGPTISQAAYEVGPEFYETFTAVDSAATRFFFAASNAAPARLAEIHAAGHVLPLDYGHDKLAAKIARFIRETPPPAAP